MLQVIFRKRATNYRALVQKTTCKDKAFYDSTPPASYFVAGYKHVNTDRQYNSTVGWLTLVGSLKLQVSSAEYRLFYRAFLQKRPVALRSLLIVATAYDSCSCVP